jgi:uncharacterized lipoprotein YddW (UPF0748 family)
VKFVLKTLLLVLFSFSLLVSQTKQPVKEVRAVWIATVSNLDWPSSASTAEAQRADAINILDQLKANNFNTVVLQIRARGDALYPSEIEPWSRVLTGTFGREPGWNPLQFWLEETHKRGMEFHAWWNFAYVVSGNTVPTSVGLPHIGTTQPNWARVATNSDGSNIYMDVGLPEVRDYLVNTAMEMVRGYDIDAIHFDYIRYLERIPDSWDSSTYRAHNPDGMNLQDWRRENINMFVREIYDSIKAIKPWVKVGSTPVGNYAAGVPQVGSALYGYTDVFCDSRKWLREGKHDYLAPQIYWAITGNYPFNRILADWLDNSYGRHIWGGVASYKDEPNNANNNVYNQTAQIIQNSRDQKSAGNIFYRLREYITKNDYASTKSSYPYLANIPAMPWIDSIPPATPQNLIITKIDDKTWQLTWDKVTPGADGDTAKYYNIYRSISSEIDYEDGENLYHITTNSNNSFTVKFAEAPTRNYYFLVTALDKNNVESAPSNIVPIIVTTDVADLEKPDEFKLYQNYPNPFNPTTNIAYHIPSRTNVRLSVYNILGQEVSVIVNEVKNAGDYLVKFDASNLSTGVYIYKIDVSIGNQGFIDHKKMLLTK